MTRLVRLTISLVTAVALGWALFLASMSIMGPSGAFCLDPDGTRPPDSGCVHVAVDPVMGRGMSNHETSRTDASGRTVWYHEGTPVTGPIAAPMLVTVPILTVLAYLAMEALELREEAAAARRPGVSGGAARP